MIYCLIPTTPDRNKRLLETIESIQKSVCNQRVQVLIDYNNYEGFVRSALRLVNSIDGLCMIVPNDVILGADAIQQCYNAYIKNFPDNDGLVGWTDGLMEIEYMCFPFAHSRTLRELINPVYFHNFSDREWTEIMKARERYFPITTPLCIHNHYSRKPELLDKTYQVNEDSSSRDGKIYWERFKNGFPKGIPESCK